MSWHPDKCRKLAVAYSSCVFQKLAPCKDSYVWDIGKYPFDCMRRSFARS